MLFVLFFPPLPPCCLGCGWNSILMDQEDSGKPRISDVFKSWGPWGLWGTELQVQLWNTYLVMAYLLGGRKKKWTWAAFLLDYLRVHAKFLQLYLAFWDPMDYSQPGSSVCGTFQSNILEWVAISFSWGSSRTRDRTHVSCIGRQILYHWAIQEPQSKLGPPMKYSGYPELFLHSSVFKCIFL